MFLQDFMAKNRFLPLLAWFLECKKAQNWNGQQTIVYGSINLKFFWGGPDTILELPCEERSPNPKKNFSPGYWPTWLSALVHLPGQLVVQLKGPPALPTWGNFDGTLVFSKVKQSLLPTYPKLGSYENLQIANGSVRVNSHGFPSWCMIKLSRHTYWRW